MHERVFEGPAFVPFAVTTVFKFGGSLLEDPYRARDLVREIEGLDVTLVVFPGGGPMDDILHHIAERTDLEDSVYCNACLRAIDQTGYLLCAWGERLQPAETLADVRAMLAQGKVPVLIPSQMIIALDLFTQDNIITSDTLGSFFAYLLGADLYVVATNVDGVCDVDAAGRLGATRKLVNATELQQRGAATSVDACLADFAKRIGLEIVVMNGNRPGEAEFAMRGQATPWSTRIRPV